MTAKPFSLPGRTWTVLAVVVATLLGSLVFYLHSPWGHGDVDLYRRYARAFWLGPHAFHSLPAEYPILSLLPFSLTLLPPLPDDVTVYGLWMLLLLIVGLLAVARREAPRVAETCGVYLALGGFGTVLGRFDLVPAAVVAGAWWAVRDRRFVLAYTLLAAGTLLKLYPLFLLPVVVIEHRRCLGGPIRSRPPRALVGGVALYAGAVAAGFAVAWLLAPGSWLDPILYERARPLQVESVPASLLWLSGLIGFSVRPDHSFHSYNLVGTLAGPLSALSLLALAAGCLSTYWRQARGRIGFGPALVLSLLVVICTSRVLSPQYLIWALPLVAFLERGHRRRWLGVCALTTAVFPFGYELSSLHGTGAPAYPEPFLALIAARNALLVASTVGLLRSVPAAEPEPRRLVGSVL
ncbi:MAG TPA: glycosyltransferase 87 family protein [Candidatus Dormibacteraeota bacterium]|nr:glycosyltransferase 87 family protein [Candidatus Dormibacteraeota bacterium]